MDITLRALALEADAARGRKRPVARAADLSEVTVDGVPRSVMTWRRTDIWPTIWGGVLWRPC